jgi:bis(5'-adenosyl)-triphosphatase
MEASYKFGPYKIDSREVFHATPLSYAMVNLRPFLPGIIPYPSSALESELSSLQFDYT